MLKALLKKDYPNAVSMEISIEFPTEHLESNYASVCVSPTRHIVEKDVDLYEDYDWNDIDLPCDEVDELISLALNQ